ncbi:cupin domain-containing protein [Thauera phenolivorans]|uniref:cupin domain-containing protein n=1 Tax=Thauera phenolivorans TaxID=1792543 RepID=UPI000839E438|nr:cupin domain-containing protein [Thauera phenolivorans]
MSEKFFVGKLLADLPPPADEEHFERLHAADGVSIGRIISHGQSSPPGFWYEQAGDEWVAVVAGEAILEFDDGRSLEMRVGDWVLLPAGCRHRVARTASPTVWLAVHLPSAGCADVPPLPPATGSGGLQSRS